MKKTKKFFKEFKEFATKGNAVDLAVGVIIGAAFQTIVKSLTSDILSPILGVFSTASMEELSIDFFGSPIRYGAFLSSVINFIIMAFVVFLIIKALNSASNIGEKIKKKNLKRLKKGKELIEEEPLPEPVDKVCPFCFSTVNIKATRCPFCTSELCEPDGESQTSKLETADTYQ